MSAGRQDAFLLERLDGLIVSQGLGKNVLAVVDPIIGVVVWKFQRFQQPALVVLEADLEKHARRFRSVRGEMVELRHVDGAQIIPACQVVDPFGEDRPRRRAGARSSR